MPKEKVPAPEEPKGDVSTEEEPTAVVEDEDFLPKTDDDVEEEGDETSETPEEDDTSEEDDGEVEGLGDELDLDDFEELETPAEKKSGVQKRIDQLTARLKAIEEENATLKKHTSSDKLPEYSENQLRTAMSKALEDGDANLVFEIMDYRIQKAEKAAVEKFIKDNEKASQQQQKHQQEWLSVVDEYSYLSDNEEPELYKGSHKELNVKDANSTLLKLANKLFLDPERASRYQKDGGQRLAVSDAIRMILRKRNTKVTSKETKTLKRQLAKEKKKSTVSSGKAIKSESTTPITPKSTLEDYLSERRQSKRQIAGGI